LFLCKNFLEDFLEALFAQVKALALAPRLIVKHILDCDFTAGILFANIANNHFDAPLLKRKGWRLV
jgi:hypothetical protein